MRLAKSIFLFEFRRIVGRKNIFIFLLFGLICLYFVNSGLSRYETTKLSSEQFLKYEENKMKHYLNYEQYGGFGFNVLALPPKLSIYFNYNHFDYKSQIDVNYLLKINSSIKGADYFKTVSYGFDFSHFFFTFGSLLMLLFGCRTFSSENVFRFRKNVRNISLTIFVRFSIIFFIFIFIFLCSYVYGDLLISFSTNDAFLFFHFSLYSLIFVSVFFFVGLLCSIILNFKNISVCFLIWFCLCFVFPEIQKILIQKYSTKVYSNESIDIQKLDAYSKYESGFLNYIKALDRGNKDYRQLVLNYIVKHYKKTKSKNNEVEKKLVSTISKEMNTITTRSILSPPWYFYILSREISGKGFSQYKEFSNDVMNIRDQFFDFYLKNRFITPTTEIELFPAQQILKLESNLPTKHLFSILTLLAYFFFLVSAMLFAIKKKLRPGGKEFEQIAVPELDKGEVNFLCVQGKRKNRIINYLFLNGAEVLRKTYDFEEVKIKSWVEFYSNLFNIDSKNVINNLLSMGIEITGTISKADTEKINLLLLALKVSGENKLLVFDDFLKGFSHRFEDIFFKTIKNNQIKSIYISQDMYSFKAPNSGLQFITVDNQNVSLC